MSDVGRLAEGISRDRDPPKLHSEYKLDNKTCVHRPPSGCNQTRRVPIFALCTVQYVSEPGRLHLAAAVATCMPCRDSASPDTSVESWLRPRVDCLQGYCIRLLMPTIPKCITGPDCCHSTRRRCAGVRMHRPSTWNSLAAPWV